MEIQDTIGCDLLDMQATARPAWLRRLYARQYEWSKWRTGRFARVDRLSRPGVLAAAMQTGTGLLLIAPNVDSMTGGSIEGKPIYEGSGFYQKTHIQIAVCNLDCIKGVFRVPEPQLRAVDSI